MIEEVVFAMKEEEELTEVVMTPGGAMVEGDQVLKGSNQGDIYADQDGTLALFNHFLKTFMCLIPTSSIDPLKRLASSDQVNR
uniref:Uncharacterized protein n=1 Tax=Timema cristinae TaxID=61476 RepID=A0A7R9DNW0_TIMCR|nr:unnamed protein product [Timema cristinae]